jgi:hypothetical protein
MLFDCIALLIREEKNRNYYRLQAAFACESSYFRTYSLEIGVLLVLWDITTALFGKLV